MKVWLTGLSTWLPPDSSIMLHNNISSFTLLIVLLVLLHLNQVHPKYPGTRMISIGYFGFGMTVILIMLSRNIADFRPFVPFLAVTGKYWMLTFFIGHVYRLVKRHGPGPL